MAGLRAGLALLGELAAPLLLLLAAALAAAKGEDVYAGLTAGAKKGLRLTAELFPALAALFPVLWLFRASGLPELLEGLLHPVFAALCIPEETALLLLLRPFSGSGALSAAAEIIRRTGADSLAGRSWNCNWCICLNRRHIDCGITCNLWNCDLRTDRNRSNCAIINRRSNAILCNACRSKS